MLANVAVKISVFNNSNLIYTMFGGSLGLYAGLRFMSIQLLKCLKQILSQTFWTLFK